MAINLTGSNVLILGAGVTGIAVAKSLSVKGAAVEFADDQVSEIENFPVFTTETAGTSTKA